MRMPKRGRKRKHVDTSETLVLDQCALFALRCAVGAAQDREVSSQEIIGALRTAAKWALAHRHKRVGSTVEVDEKAGCSLMVTQELRTAEIDIPFWVMTGTTCMCTTPSWQRCSVSTL